uniref:uncharacterized protein LOC120335567 n=1 Tax=Styela clava TaxID=7725 RepID=UPI001939AC35|nr:uncharacterized protein LOC120335567 [Styela clava]
MDNPNNSLLAEDNCESAYSESVTDDYNTADLSNLSGLSKILKADDSIADKVRCLLEEDNDAESMEKPELLSIANENAPTDSEIKEKMLTLFKDVENSTETADQEHIPPGDMNTELEVETQDEKEESIEEEQMDKSDDTVKLSSADISILRGNRDDLGNPEGNGAEDKPIQLRQDSSDDIMNISDSTEYSDLPKVVDNPMKNSRSNIASNSYPVLSEYMKKVTKTSSDESSSENSNAKITGNAKFYSDSDPNTPQFSDDPEKLQHLEKYVQRRQHEHEPEKLSELGSHQPSNTRLETLRSGGGPIHSTPFSYPRQLPLSKLSESEIPNGTLNSTKAPSLSKVDSLPTPVEKRCSHESNITLRSRNSDVNNATPTEELIHESLAGSATNYSQLDLPANLGDEEILEKVKRAVAVNQDEKFTNSKSSGLRGPHTVSEHSIASTVDSLAAQVKNLLREESAQQHMITGDLSDINVNEISQHSNFSDEISNFEKTNLWKYTRQFLPGALTPSREIQPLTKFGQSSPMQAREIDTDSSDVSSPETYRISLTQTPQSLRNSKSKTPPAMKTLFRQPGQSKPMEENKTSHEMPVMRFSDGKPSNEGKASISASSRHSYPVGGSSTPHKSSSRIVGRYGKYPKENYDIFTPQNESYKQLEPEVTQTQTPYSFITPRKVAWEEPEKVDIVPVVKYRSPLPRPSKPCTTQIPRRNQDMQETSSYFRPERLRGERPFHTEKSPSISLRQDGVKLKKLTPQKDVSIKMYEPRMPDKSSEKSVRDTNIYTSEDHITVKSLTPPHSYERRRLPEAQTENLKLSSSLNLKQSQKSSQPKSVHFKESSYSSLTRSTPEKSLERPMRNPEYSFTTPRVSGYQSPRNITPKIVKEKPRIGKVLPTYDQLVAEQKHQEKPKQESDVPENVQNKGEKKSAGIQKPTKDTEIEVNTDFSPLEPESCSDDSDEENTLLENLSTPKHKRKEENLDLSLSDTELHRRTTLSQSSDDSEDEKSGHFRNSANGYLRSDLSDSNEKYVERDQQSVSTPSPTPIEPAPLPYVRLGKEKPTMPPIFSAPQRHSISTEKVQNLLMKEKNVGKQSTRTRNTGVSASMPVTNKEPSSSSSDEELMNLLETFSTKVPLMEKLLRKLYEKNLHKKSEKMFIEHSQLDDGGQELVNKSAQTLQDDIRVLRTNSTNIPQQTQRNRRKIYAESASQTSFTKLSNTEVTEEGIYSSFDKSNQVTPKQVVAERKNKEKIYSGEGKENIPQKQQPCAFFVDLTPEKLPREQPDEKLNQSPVAWYEPYEYMPPWRQRSMSNRPKMGFVDVNIQDAFLDKKRDFVLRSWERQEDIALRAEERKLKELEEKIHEQILALHNERADVSPRPSAQEIANAAPKNKADRVFGWKEMKMSSKMKYESLPEVVARKRDAERKKYYEANRKKALQYKRKVTQMVLQKQKSKPSAGVR